MESLVDFHLVNKLRNYSKWGTRLDIEKRLEHLAKQKDLADAKYQQAEKEWIQAIEDAPDTEEQDVFETKDEAIAQRTKFLIQLGAFIDLGVMKMKPGDRVWVRGPLVSWEVGDELTAVDFTSKMEPARIIDARPGEVLVTFTNWSAKWDEWIPKNSLKLFHNHEAASDVSKMTFHYVTIVSVSSNVRRGRMEITVISDEGKYTWKPSQLLKKSMVLPNALCGMTPEQTRECYSVAFPKCIFDQNIV